MRSGLMDALRITALLALGVAAGYIAICRKPADRRLADFLFYTIILFGVDLLP